jgi:hypothetical protein
MEGGIDELIESVMTHFQAEKLKAATGRHAEA